jgi:hypothetical protein
VTLKENIEAPLSVGLYGQCKPTMENEPDARRMAAAESSLAGNSFGMLITPGMQGRRPMMGEPAASMINLGPVSTEEVSVPDKIVGLSEYIY